MALTFRCMFKYRTSSERYSKSADPPSRPGSRNNLFVRGTAMADMPSKSSTVMQWMRSSPEGKRQQVDAALEWALEATLAERPIKPLKLMASKLREWDAAVNGDWPLRREAESVFARADVDGSGHLDLTELSAMRQDQRFADLVMLYTRTHAPAAAVAPQTLARAHPAPKPSLRRLSHIAALLAPRIASTLFSAPLIASSPHIQHVYVYVLCHVHPDTAGSPHADA